MKDEPIERLVAQRVFQAVLQRIHGGKFGDKGDQTDQREFDYLPNIAVASHERLALFVRGGRLAL